MYTIQKGKAENVTEGSGEGEESSLSTSSFRFDAFCAKETCGPHEQQPISAPEHEHTPIGTLQVLPRPFVGDAAPCCAKVPRYLSFVLSAKRFTKAHRWPALPAWMMKDGHGSKRSSALTFRPLMLPVRAASLPTLTQVFALPPAEPAANY